jgi:hypothetical protein
MGSIFITSILSALLYKTCTILSFVWTMRQDKTEPVVYIHSRNAVRLDIVDTKFTRQS